MQTMMAKFSSIGHIHVELACCDAMNMSKNLSWDYGFSEMVMPLYSLK